MSDSGLLFSEDHIWVSFVEEHTARLGVSDYAQRQIGSILFLNLPEAGERVACGECFGDIESHKTVTDLVSPVTGTVLRVNEDLLDYPDQIHQAPYEHWMLEVRVDQVSGRLMGAEGYEAYLREACTGEGAE